MRARTPRLLTAACAAGLAMALVACGSAPTKRPVFYQDDGPPDRVPADIAAIPDAMPRVEPQHRGSTKPYVALGRSYTPLTGDPAFRQRGLASWYGKQFHGNRTASGEIYDMFAMTAAHPTLPLPSYVRVTGVRSGHSVLVRVNDRGPFHDGRIIDLSYAAATKLGIAAGGTGEVEIERITMTQIAAGTWPRGESPTQVASAATSATSNATTSVPTSMVTPVVAPVGAVVAPSAAGTPAPAAAAAPARGWSVQLGAFSQQVNAEALAGRTSALITFLETEPSAIGTPRIERDGSVWRVLVGSSSDRESAQALARELERVLERPTSIVLR